MLKIEIYDFQKNITKTELKIGGNIFETDDENEPILTEVFPDDSIKIIKEKIYLATGIWPCEQYLFLEERIGFEVMYLDKIVNNSPFDLTDSLDGLPIFMNFYRMKDLISIIDKEHITLKEIGMPEKINVLSLKSNKPEKYDEMLYWSLVQFFPYFNSSAFSDYINNNYNNYPLLFVNRFTVHKKLQYEIDIMKKIYANKKKNKIDSNILELTVLIQKRGEPELQNIFNLVKTSEIIPVIIYNEKNIVFSKVYFKRETEITNNLLKSNKNCLFFVVENIVYELDRFGNLFATIYYYNSPLNFENSKKYILDSSKKVLKLLDNLEISLFKSQKKETEYEIIRIKTILRYSVEIDTNTFTAFLKDINVPGMFENNMWIKSAEFTPIEAANAFDYYCNNYERTVKTDVTIQNKFTEIQIILSQFNHRDFHNIYKYFEYFLSQIKPVEINMSERSNLRILRAVDPKNYRTIGTKKPFTRVCQKPRQPLPWEKGKPLVNSIKFWNYTKEEPMMFYCPNKNYPYPGFITGFHPDGNCMLCCFKKKEKMDRKYHDCMQKHIFEQQKSSSSAKYIVNFGKELNAGRISNLPAPINKFLIYNLDNINLISETANLQVFKFNGRVYSTERLFKYTEKTKIQELPVSLFISFLKTPVWKRKRLGKELIKPIEVLENPKKNPKFLKHYKRILNADLSQPIFVYNDKGSLTILDGVHRLAKAFLEKVTVIKTKIITSKQLAKCYLRKYEITDKSFLPVSVTIKGGNDKDPFYYIMGVENNNYLNSIASAMELTEEDMVKNIINKLKNLEFVNNYNAQDLINKIQLTFFKQEHFDYINWDQIFSEILPILFDFVPIELEYNKQIFLHMQHTYSKLDKSENNFIILFKQENKYNPVFIIIPFIYGKYGKVEKRIFTFDDQLVKIIDKLLDKKKQETVFTLQKIIDMDYGKINVLNHNGEAYAVEINNNIYVSVDKVKLQNTNFEFIKLGVYDFDSSMDFLKKYSLKYAVSLDIDKLFIYNNKVVAYRVAGYVNFVNAEITDFPKIPTETLNYAPEIIMNAKTTKTDPILQDYLSYDRNAYTFFKENYFKNGVNDNEEFYQALQEECKNPIKKELFDMGIYNFKKIYINKHKNENIYIKIK